ncbi:hypothetical protein JCM19038_2709 [Geomicrobium sp. JCM 19038]|nr:hypothetical protein JCM19038_2709 [Geomicrobium sp. JCM 19038]
MKVKKNKVMLFFTGFFIGLLLLVMVLHRGVGWLDRYLMLTGRAGSGDSSLVITFLLILPVVFFIVALLNYIRSKEHDLIEWFVMLSLTFGSIALMLLAMGLLNIIFRFLWYSQLLLIMSTCGC